MEENRDDPPDEGQSANFALLIRQNLTPQGVTYNIQSQNQGIPEPTIILLVECWLEKVKDQFKGGVKDNIFFNEEPK